MTKTAIILSHEEAMAPPGEMILFGHSEFERIKVEFAKHVHKSKEQWLAQECKQFCSPVMLRWIREGKNLSAIARWISRQGFHVRIISKEVWLYRFDKPISKWNPPKLREYLNP